MKPRTYRLRMQARSSWLADQRECPRTPQPDRIQSDATLARENGITKREVRRQRELNLSRRRVAAGLRITPEHAIALGLQASRSR